MIAAAPLRIWPSMRLVAASGSAMLLSGCVAAALPLLAAGAIAGDANGRGEPRAALARPPAPPAAAPPAPADVNELPPLRPGDVTVLTALPTPRAAEITPRAAEITPRAAEITPRPAAGFAPAAPPRIAANFAAVAAHVAQRHRLYREGAPIQALVLDGRASILAPRMMPCGQRRPIVLIDADAGNIGPDAGTGGDAAEGWRGLVSTLRQEGVGIWWVSAAQDSGRLAAKLAAAGLDPSGQDRIATGAGTSVGKQQLRAELADANCVLAVVGDQRSDADEAYAYLRDPDTPLPTDNLWGDGWFLLPAPLVPQTESDTP